MSQLSHQYPDRPELWGGAGGASGGESVRVDHPTVYECEASSCRHKGMAVDDGDMEQCQHCDGWFCPAHLVMEKAGHYDVCLACRHQHDIDAVMPKYGND